MKLPPAGRWLRLLRPPKNWMPLVLIAGGIFCGLGFVTLHISNATSYLVDDPRACINCHIMIPHYATWQNSSHARVTTCNSCHVPQDSFFRKWKTKAQDGGRHAFMFTFRLEPDVIRIHEAGQNVVMENCMRCHEHDLQQTSLREITASKARHGEGMLCWECHREVPHGQVHSGSTPHARVPQLEPAIPEWLRTLPARSSSPSQRETTP